MTATIPVVCSPVSPPPITRENMNKASWWMEHWPYALWAIAIMQTIQAWFVLK